MDFDIFKSSDAAWDFPINSVKLNVPTEKENTVISY